MRLYVSVETVLALSVKQLFWRPGTFSILPCYLQRLKYYNEDSFYYFGPTFKFLLSSSREAIIQLNREMFKLRARRNPVRGRALQKILSRPTQLRRHQKRRRGRNLLADKNRETILCQER